MNVGAAVGSGVTAEVGVELVHVSRLNSRSTAPETKAPQCQIRAAGAAFTTC